MIAIPIITALLAIFFGYRITQTTGDHKNWFIYGTIFFAAATIGISIWMWIEK